MNLIEMKKEVEKLRSLLQRTQPKSPTGFVEWMRKIDSLMTKLNERWFEEYEVGGFGTVSSRVPTSKNDLSHLPMTATGKFAVVTGRISSIKSNLSNLPKTEDGRPWQPDDLWKCPNCGVVGRLMHEYNNQAGVVCTYQDEGSNRYRGMRLKRHPCYEEPLPEPFASIVTHLEEVWGEPFTRGVIRDAKDHTSTSGPYPTMEELLIHAIQKLDREKKQGSI